MKKYRLLLSILLVTTMTTSNLLGVPAVMALEQEESKIEEKLSISPDKIAKNEENEFLEESLDISDMEVGDEEIRMAKEEPFVLPDIIDTEEAAENGYIGRDYEAEEDLSTFVFKNADGTNTLKAYSYPVKYIDDKGEIRDISLDIAENADGSFSTADNDIVTTFQKDLSDGIILNYEDIEIKMIPETEEKNVTALSADDSENVEYTVNDTTSYVYGLTYSGFKEDIVVSEYTGQTEYDFTLYTNGLSLFENDGSYYLRDTEGEIKANIGDIVVFTADEKNNAFGTMTYETVTENEEYVLTIHLDENYLKDEKTAYPIRIDPTVEINYTNNGSGAIQDVTINQYSSSDGSSGSLYVGKRSTYGISRVLMKFPNILNTLNGKTHSSSNVLQATVELRDLMCESNVMYVNCHIFTGNEWSESTASWSNVDAENYSTTLSTVGISQSLGEQQSTAHRYGFDITSAVKAWVDGSFSVNKGIIFKARSQVESGNNFINKTFASYNRASYKPSLTIRFSYTVVRNEFFSKYDPNKFNLNTVPDPADSSFWTDEIQYRMNCYGYAFRFLYDGLGGYSKEMSRYLYQQQPGNFTTIQERNAAVSSIPLNSLSNYTRRIIKYIELDASKLGYTVEEYVPHSSLIPQYGTESRLIALVTAYDNNDDKYIYHFYMQHNDDKYIYHFYMQHNDETWSHKPGVKKVTNMSINANDETDANSVILTNENIYSKSKSGKYENGEVRFFIIKRSAVIDQPHTSSSSDINLMIAINNCEKSGDYLETSVTQSVGSTTNSKLDFDRDHDVYYFTAIANRNFTISASIQDDDASLALKVYNMNGVLLHSTTGNNQLSTSISMDGGSQYFIEIYNTSDIQVPVAYSLTIS